MIRLSVLRVCQRCAMGSEYVAWLSSQPETFSCEYLAGYSKYLEMILRKEDGKITLWECSPSRGLDVGWRHVGRETMKKKAKQMMQDCNATWLQHAHAQFFSYSSSTEAAPYISCASVVRSSAGTATRRCNSDGPVLAHSLWPM